MPWTYDLPDGSSVGCFDTQDEARAARRKDRDFALEVRGGKLIYYGPGCGQVIQDSIPQHWNPAFPVPVTGRQQFKRLQKKYGTSDYEPSHDMRERIDYARKKAIHDGRR